MRSGKEGLDDKQMFVQRANRAHFGSSDSSQLFEHCSAAAKAEQEWHWDASGKMSKAGGGGGGGV